MRLCSRGIRCWLALAVAFGLFAAAGCSVTCRRMEKDRKKFFDRKPNTEETHMEMIVPFPVADALIAGQLGEIKPIKVKVPGLGSLGSYFGDLKVAPRKVSMIPAPDDLVGFKLDLDVLDGGKPAFSMALSTQVAPNIDLEARRIELALTPESLKSIKPVLSKDAGHQLGGIIYERIPKAARLFVSRGAVDAAAGSVVNQLVTSLYQVSKDTMLKQLGDKSRFSFNLPDIPLSKVRVSSLPEPTGALVLRIATNLPVDKGIVVEGGTIRVPPPGVVTVRTSGATVAELTNWAIDKGLLPQRYDKSGKPKDDGEFRMGVAWKSGKKPMKVYLWKSPGPCMRITLGAQPSVAVDKGQMKIKADKAEIEDVEGAPFTVAAVKFYALWKDAATVSQKTNATVRLEVAGRQVEAVVTTAQLKDDELTMGIGLTVADK